MDIRDQNILVGGYFLSLLLLVIVSWVLYTLHLVHLVIPMVGTFMPIASLLILLCVYLKRQLNSRAFAFRIHEAKISRISESYLRLTEADLLQATANFSEQRIIGKGRFGTVYRGILPNGRNVALKRMKLQDPSSKKHFLAELQILGQIRHRNLLRILGYFFNNEEMIIVSKFMPKHSLDFLLLHCRLGWKERLNIAVGVAQGLAYLHHDCRNTIVHSDLKPGNILLDKNLEPHIADFGMAKIINENQITERSFGTPFTVGYTAPERTCQVRPSSKEDVYSFGIIMLELVSGVRPTSSLLVNKGITFTEWVKTVRATNNLTELLDDCLKSDTEFHDEMEKVIQMGIVCTSENPKMRPEMKDLVTVLMGIKEGIRQFNIPISILIQQHYQNSDRVSEASVSSVSSCL